MSKTMPTAGNLEEALASVKAFCKDTGIDGAVEAYTSIDTVIRTLIDLNQGVKLGAMVQLFQNILVGFTASICAFYATSVIDDQQDDFVDTFKRRFLDGVNAAVPALIEAIEAKEKARKDEHSKNTRTGGLH